jgi:hypothetical protein
MRWLLLLAALPAGAADSGDLVYRVRQSTFQNLSRLPNYTCRMTIDRAVRAPDRKKWLPVDTLRLDVAFVGGRELFAWPGKQFEDKLISEIVPNGGMIGTGDFAMHARAILIDERVLLSCRSGAREIECSYRVPLEHSAYEVKVADTQALAAYQGRVTFDPQTLRLRRLTVEVNEPPPGVRLRSAGTVLNYADVEIYGSVFVLPRSSELVMVGADGYESRNSIRFDACRQYSGESTISFADPADAPEQPKIQLLQLPPGSQVECALSTRLDPGIAIGDPMKAIVTRPVRKTGQTLLPKGAELLGRLTRLHHVRMRGLEYWVVGVQFDAMSGPNAAGGFAADLKEVGGSASQNYVPHATDFQADLNIWNVVRDHPAPNPGESIFYVRGSTLRTNNLRMVWRTK